MKKVNNENEWLRKKKEKKKGEMTAIQWRYLDGSGRLSFHI